MIFLIIIFIQNIASTLSQNTEIIPEDSGTRVAGIGYGVVIIIIGFVISGCICLCSPATTKPEIISLLGLFIPLILIVIFVAAPKEYQRDQSSQEKFVSDDFFRLRIFYMCVMLIFTLLALFWLFLEFIFWDHITRKPANWRKQDELQKKENEDIQESKEKEDEDEDEKKAMLRSHKGKEEINDWTQGTRPEQTNLAKNVEFDFSKNKDKKLVNELGPKKDLKTEFRSSKK